MTFDRSLALSLATTLEALSAKTIAPNVTCAGTDTQCLVEKIAEGKYAVVFPGTASLHDMLTDLRVHKVKWGAGKVHTGFIEAYQSIYSDLAKQLPVGAQLVIAGHSLGGALATLCAITFRVRCAVTGVYTFGSPRVGNGAFARDYNDTLADRTFRVVNAHDPIPHVPFECATYRHVATQVYLKEDGTLQIDEPWRVMLAEWEATLDVIETPTPAGLAFASEHGITHYRRKLESLVA